MIVIILGAIVYGGLVILFKVDEVKIVTEEIKRKFLTLYGNKTTIIL